MAEELSTQSTTIRAAAILTNADVASTAADVANFNQAEINGLQLNQVFEVGMHPRLILAQAQRRA